VFVLIVKGLNCDNILKTPFCNNSICFLRVNIVFQENKTVPEAYQTLQICLTREKIIIKRLLVMFNIFIDTLINHYYKWMYIFSSLYN